MEKSEHMELEILIAIRNNPKVPVDEFYTIFEHRWPEYRALMSDQYNNGLFIVSSHEVIPGLNRLELTSSGKRRETELLLERSIGLSKILAMPKKTKNRGQLLKKLLLKTRVGLPDPSGSPSF
jgi:hypothetical protein